MQLFIIGGAFAKRTRLERDVGMVNFDNPRIRDGLGIWNDPFFTERDHPVDLGPDMFSRARMPFVYLDPPVDQLDIPIMCGHVCAERN